MNKTKPTKDKTPTSPCSVVWYDGHPFVLDGEPGTSLRAAGSAC